MSTRLAFQGSLAAAMLALSGCSSTLNCGRQPEPRGQAICRSTEKHLEYQVFVPHGGLSPGYYATPDTVGAVWCETLPVPADQALLRRMARRESLSDDPRLSNAAHGLYQVLTQTTPSGLPIGPYSVYNPSNPKYVLKGRCSAPRAK